MTYPMGAKNKGRWPRRRNPRFWDIACTVITIIVFAWLILSR